MFSRLKQRAQKRAQPSTRLAPEHALPPYAFVPRHFPHPVRNPEGHSYKKCFDYETPPDEKTWATHRPYFFALDLFNHGYYWEAHEAFEHWWKQVDKGNPRRAFFQALLRVCAAGVKVRQGSQAGIHSHANKAAILFTSVQEQLPSNSSQLLGLDVDVLREFCEALALKARIYAKSRPVSTVEVVLPLRLHPHRMDA